MQIRTLPFPHETQERLDGMLSEDEITAATYKALLLYGEIGRVVALTTIPEGRGYGRRYRATLALADYAGEILKALPPTRARAVMDGTFPSLLQQVYSLAEALSNWAYEDMRKGGAMLPFRREWRCRRDGRPTPRVRRKLYSQEWIRRYVRNDECAARARTMTMQFLEIRSGIIGPDPTVDDIHQVDVDVRLQRSRLALRPQQALTGPRVPLRRVAKRAAVMAAALLGTTAVSAFARGEPIVLQGQEMGFSIARAGSVFAADHGALQVKLLSPEQQPLADLCVYFPELPAIDQLTAMALHVQSGLEREVFEKANVIQATPEGAAHPLLADRLKQRLATPNWTSPYQQERDLQREYWTETALIWREALGVFVFGQRVYRPMTRFFASAERAA